MVMVTFVTYLAVYLMLLAAYIGVLKYMAEHPPKLADAGANTGKPTEPSASIHQGV
jgi:cytochrome d ubiquinol oxidase subunit I